MRKTELVEHNTAARSRNRWWGLVALCGAVLLVMIDNTIVNVALPTISRDLGASTVRCTRIRSKALPHR